MHVQVHQAGHALTRVLGIDPGSRVTGYGVIDTGRDGLACVTLGCVRMAEPALAERLKHIYDGLARVIEQHQPDIVAVEQVFMASNPRSALVLGQARGAAICAAVNHGLPVTEYSALQIKRAVVGTGAAAKQQVQHMVRVLLGLTVNPAADAADALACAICHIHTADVMARINEAAR